MTTQLENDWFSSLLERFEAYALTVFAVALTTGAMFLIGRETLGEGVISLVYLVPIAWSAARWGRGPGIAAAVAAALSFDFFFIPPFYTFTVGSLEGWLLLGIFLTVAVVIVGRIQVGLTRAQQREREAIYMYELSSALAGVRSEESVARILADKIQQVFQADLVQIFIEGKDRSVVARVPQQEAAKGKPDRVLPILAGATLVGEINLWEGAMRLPSLQDRLLQNFANQGALALHRARLIENRNKKDIDEPAF